PFSRSGTGKMGIIGRVEGRCLPDDCPEISQPSRFDSCRSLKNRRHLPSEPFGFTEIDDKPPGSFRKKSARGCMFMGNKQIKEIRFGKLGGSQSLFLSSRGARPFF